MDRVVVDGICNCLHFHKLKGTILIEMKTALDAVLVAETFKLENSKTICTDVAKRLDMRKERVLDASKRSNEMISKGSLFHQPKRATRKDKILD